MKQWISIIGIGLGISPWLIGQAGGTAPGPVAYVSGQRIATESIAGKAAQTRLEAVRQQKTADLKSRQKAIEDTRQKLTVAGPGSEREALQRVLQEQQIELARTNQQAQVDLQNLQREIVAELQPQVRSVLDELLKGTNVQIVLQRETAIVWAIPEGDLTSAVIARMDARSASEGEPRR
jgi:Skp family chaperone for outer membrane proteins